MEVNKNWIVCIPVYNYFNIFIKNKFHQFDLHNFKPKTNHEFVIILGIMSPVFLINLPVNEQIQLRSHQQMILMAGVKLRTRTEKKS